SRGRGQRARPPDHEISRQGLTAMKKSFNLKPFLLEKGERVGLFVAGGLALLLVLLGLFKGLSSGSASAHAQKLDEQVTKLQQAQQRATPGRDDLPPEGVDPINYGKTVVALADYPGHSLFLTSPIKDSKRQSVTVFTPDEAYVEVVRANLPALVFDFENRGET